MVFKGKAKNRRFEREHVLDVKLRTREVRAARLKLLGTALAISLGTVGGLWLVWRGGEWGINKFVYTNDAFAIRHLDIQTDGVIALDRIQKWAGVKQGDNLFALDLARVKRDLELVPLVESVALERMLPDTLRVRVTEREPVAVVKVPHLTPAGVEFVHYRLDVSGYVILLKDLLPFLAPGVQTNEFLPLLTGLDGALLTPGRVVNSPAAKAALRLITEFDISPMAGLAHLETIDVSNPGLLQVTTGQGNHITFSLDRIEEQLRRWRLVTDFGRRNGRAILSLDLSVTNNSPALWLEAGTVPAPPLKLKPQTRSRRRHV